MIVTMRQGIKPLCNQCGMPMKLYQFGDPTGFMMKAYKCDSCTRAFNSSQGYFDIVNDQLVRLEHEQEDCHCCELPMYLESVQGQNEFWRCAQVGCDYVLQKAYQPQL
jgi:hypothetical protein